MKPYCLIIVLALFALFFCERQQPRLDSRTSRQQYTENDVRNFVIPGTPRDAIITRFGEPVVVEKNPKFEDGSTDIDEILDFYLPSAPRGTKEDFVFAGFQVYLRDGKAVQWMSNHRSSN
jgi:hypothetical protein